MSTGEVVRAASVQRALPPIGANLAYGKCFISLSSYQIRIRADSVRSDMKAYLDITDFVTLMVELVTCVRQYTCDLLDLRLRVIPVLNVNGIAYSWLVLARADTELRDETRSW